MNKPRVLFYDIETAYSEARIWRTGEQYVTHEQIIANRASGIICICYKWAGEKKIHSLDWGVKKQDNDAMVEKFTKIIESADVAVAHNGISFDSKHLNTQRLLAGKSPIDWCQTEDTLKAFRRLFSLPSNKLDYLGQILLNEKKHPMAFIDWVNVVEGKCPKALDKMLKYCRKDVMLLERVYDKAKPFMTPKVSRSIIMHDHKAGCPSCGSLKITSNGFRNTASGRHRRLICQCGHNFKGKTEKLPK